VWLAAGGVSLRLSVGWAEIRPDRTVDVTIREAEQRMFDDRRRSEPVDPVITTNGRIGRSGRSGRNGRSAVLQPTRT
jgi:hypothetical protein